MRHIVLAMSAVLVLSSCSSSEHPQGPPSTSASLSPAANTPLTTCVDPNPPATKPVTGPIAADIVNDRVIAPISLDGGKFTVDPAPATATAISATFARCNLLAGVTSNGQPFTDAATTQLTFGLGLVTVPDSMLSGKSTMDGVTGASLPKPPPLTAYHRRLAWIGVSQPSLTGSCPPQTPNTHTSAPQLPGYQIMVIDATTGAGGMLYVAASNSGCFPSTILPPALNAGVAVVSVPWTLVSRNADGHTATISFAARSCDGFANQAIVDRDHPNTVTVTIEKPLADCGQATRQTARLLSATTTTPLPTTLIHGPVGAQDVATN